MKNVLELVPGTELWNETLEKDYPPMKITEHTREMTLYQAKRFRSAMRISTGKFWTDQKYEDFHQRVFKTPLP